MAREGEGDEDMSAAANDLFIANIKSCGLRALDWVYRFAQELDPESLEYGGIRNNYDPMRREFRRSGHGLCLTWSACLAGFAGLAAYDLTCDRFYFDRVRLLARYVNSSTGQALTNGCVI